MVKPARAAGERTGVANTPCWEAGEWTVKLARVAREQREFCESINRTSPEWKPAVFFSGVSDGLDSPMHLDFAIKFATTARWPTKQDRRLRLFLNRFLALLPLQFGVS